MIIAYDSRDSSYDRARLQKSINLFQGRFADEKSNKIAYNFVNVTKSKKEEIKEIFIMSIVDDLKRENEQDRTLIVKPEEVIKRWMKFLEGNTEEIVKEVLKSPKGYNRNLGCVKDAFDHDINFGVSGFGREVKSFFSKNMEYTIYMNFPCFTENRKADGTYYRQQFSAIDCIGFQSQAESFLKHPKWGFKKVSVKPMSGTIDTSAFFDKNTKEKIKFLHIEIRF